MNNSEYLTNSPKNIFQVAIRLNYKHEAVQESINKMLDKNPTWKYKIFTEKSEIDEFMYKNFSQSSDKFENKIFETYKEIPNLINYPPKLGKLIAQLDLFRVAAVYLYGGLYLDIDSELTGDFNQFLKSDAVFFLTNTAEIFNACFYSVPKHAMLKKILETINENILVHKQGNLYAATGPSVHTHIAQELFDFEIVNYKKIIKKPLEFNGSSLYYDDANSESLSLKIEAPFKPLLYSQNGENFNRHWHGRF